MHPELSFLKNPFLRLLENAHLFFPGIEKVVVVFYDNGKKEISAACVLPKKNPGVIDPVGLGDNKAIVQKSRGNKTPTAWYTRKELPYDLQPLTRNQIEIFEERMRTVLLLRFPNNYDGMQDLVFLHFQESMSMFGLNLASRSLSTDFKSIIGFLVHHFILTFTRLIEADTKAVQSIIDSTKSTISEMMQAKEEMRRTQEYYGQSLVDLCQNYLEEFQKETGRYYRLHESAFRKIRTYSGEIKHLKTIIRNAILYSDYLSGISSPGPIFVYDWHLNTQIYVPDTKKEPLHSYPEDRYAKTIYLLNRLESAAKEVVRQNLKLTGRNVGQFCEKPITAAAITDALDKHKKKIAELFARYPEKWEIIRNDFRPVRNATSS